MSQKTKYAHYQYSAENREKEPFINAEEAWFWFIQANQALQEGAQLTAGKGLYNRPCEPLDILCVLNNLHRKRRLLMDHLRVLKYYGSRGMAPDYRRSREMKAHKLWTEALDRIEPILIKKGIVQKPTREASIWGDHLQQYTQMEGRLQ